MTDAADSRPDARTLRLVGCSDALAAVAAVLWREREALDRLLFTLVSQKLLLASGNTRWLHLAEQEVHEAADALRGAELLRAAEFDALTRQAGLPPETTLRELAGFAPEPWPLVLDEHGGVLRALALEVQTVAAENTRLLQAGEQALRETLDSLHGTASGYDAHGSAGLGARSGRNGGAGRTLSLLDEQA